MAPIQGIDDIDLQILQILQQDCRVTIKEIAARLNLSTTPIFERMKKLDKQGFILRNVAVLDPNRLNLKLIAFISISVSDHSKKAIDSFVNHVTQFPEVLECHHITGDSDFILKVILQDIGRYNEFLLSKISTVPFIANIQTSFSLSVGKNTQALPI